MPQLAEGMEQLPPFLRDTSVKLHLRSVYFNRLNSDDTQNLDFCGKRSLVSAVAFSVFRGPLGTRILKPASGEWSKPLHASAL